MSWHNFPRTGAVKPARLGKAGLLCAAAVFSALAIPPAALGEDGRDAVASLEHLLQAAAHLEQAGRQDLALICAEAAAEAAADQQRLVEFKLLQIKQLEAEVARLRTPPLAADQILIQLKVLELALDKLEASGLSLVSIRNLLDSGPSSAVSDDDGRIGQFLELLRREGLVHVVAEPKLVTVSGRKAALEVGSVAAPGSLAEQSPAADHPETVAGLRLACTPKITAPGKLSLELNFCRSAPADFAGAEDPGADPQPAGSLEVGARIEVQSGQTLILAGLRQARSAQGNTATLLMVTATIVGAEGKLPAP